MRGYDMDKTILTALRGYGASLDFNLRSATARENSLNRDRPNASSLTPKHELNASAPSVCSSCDVDNRSVTSSPNTSPLAASSIPYHSHIQNLSESTTVPITPSCSMITGTSSCKTKGSSDVNYLKAHDINEINAMQRWMAEPITKEVLDSLPKPPKFVENSIDNHSNLDSPSKCGSNYKSNQGKGQSAHCLSGTYLRNCARDCKQSIGVCTSCFNVSNTCLDYTDEIPEQSKDSFRHTKRRKLEPTLKIFDY